MASTSPDKVPPPAETSSEGEAVGDNNLITKPESNNNEVQTKDGNSQMDDEGKPMETGEADEVKTEASDGSQMTEPLVMDSDHGDNDDENETAPLQDPVDSAEKDVTHTSHHEEKKEDDSINLSTLITTIIKGTVAGMRNVGKDISKSNCTQFVNGTNSSLATSSTKGGSPTSTTQQEINPFILDKEQGSITADEGEIAEQPNKLVSESDPDNDVEEVESAPGSLQLTTDDQLVTGTYRRGRGRRGRSQQRFTLTRGKDSEMENEAPHTVVMDTINGRIYRCISCDVSFNFEQDMRMHLQTHLRPRFFCPVCSRRFLNQSTMERHMVTHNQDKPYVCGVCSQGFRIKSNLNRHYQRVHNKKPEVEEDTKKKVISPPSTIFEPPGFHPSEIGNPGSAFTMSNVNRLPLPRAQLPPSPVLSPQTQTHPFPLYMDGLPVHFSNMQGNPPFTNPYGRPLMNYDAAESNVVSSTEQLGKDPVSRDLAFNRDPVAVNSTSVPRKRPFLPTAAPAQDRFDMTFDDADRTPVDEDESYAQSFLARYPDVESAVDAIRKIETERLFHQELLLEELKLRKKYGLSADEALEDLKRNMSFDETREALDVYSTPIVGKTQGDQEPIHIEEASPMPEYPRDFLRNTRPLGSSLLPTTLPDPSLTRNELLRLQEKEQYLHPSDNRFRGPHEELDGTLTVSRQLRQLVSLHNTNLPYPKPPDYYPAAPSGLPPLAGQSTPDSSSQWTGQHLDSLPPSPAVPSRPRRGRRRLARLPPASGGLPHGHHQSPRSPATQSQPLPLTRYITDESAPPSHMVHHRPEIQTGGPPVIRPPPPRYPLPMHIQAPGFSGLPRLPLVPSSKPPRPIPVQSAHPGTQMGSPFKRLRKILPHPPSSEQEERKFFTPPALQSNPLALNTRLPAPNVSNISVPISISRGNGNGLVLSAPMSMSDLKTDVSPPAAMLGQSTRSPVPKGSPAALLQFMSNVPDILGPNGTPSQHFQLPTNVESEVSDVPNLPYVGISPGHQDTTSEEFCKPSSPVCYDAPLDLSKKPLKGVM